MATLNRLRVAWGGNGIVGPGLTTFYFSGTMAGKPAAVLAFFNAVKTLVPSGLTWDVPSSGDTLDDNTGTLTGAWTASGGGQVVSSGPAAFAAGVGCRVVLQTANIHLGRRVKGSIFLVPLESQQYDSSGTIVNSSLSIINTAAANLLTATTPDWRVWSRPNAVGAFAVSSVISAAAPDKVSTLRSRRT